MVPVIFVPVFSAIMRTVCACVPVHTFPVCKQDCYVHIYKNTHSNISVHVYVTTVAFFVQHLLVSAYMTRCVQSCCDRVKPAAERYPPPHAHASHLLPHTRMHMHHFSVFIHSAHMPTRESLLFEKRKQSQPSRLQQMRVLLALLGTCALASAWSLLSLSFVPPPSSLPSCRRCRLCF